MLTACLVLFLAPAAAAVWSLLGNPSMVRAALAVSGGTIPCPGSNLMSTRARLLVRPARLHGDVGFRAGLGEPLPAATGVALTAAQIESAAAHGETNADHVLQRHTDRLGRGLAHVINIFDPEVIVLGGGLSNLDHLYRDLPAAIAPHLFTSDPDRRHPAPEVG